MIQVRWNASGPRFSLAAIAAFLLSFLVASLQAQTPNGSIRLTDAAEQGTFNVGASNAVAGKTPDSAAGGEVVKLDYTLPPATAAGVWAKAFPKSLNPESVDIVRLGVRSSAVGQPHDVAVSAEIKGDRGVRRIALTDDPDWFFHEEAAPWQQIGALTEVVFIVEPRNSTAPVSGTLYLDLQFERLSHWRKLSLEPGSRIGGVLLTSVVLALLTLPLGRRRELSPRDSWSDAERAPTPPAAGFKQDVVYGLGAFFSVGLAVAVYLLGERGPLDVGWTSLFIAVGGAALAEWWKYGVTGKHLTAGEVFQDAFVAGLLAASVSPVALLQAPTAWDDLLGLSPIVAAVAVVVYQAINAHQLTSLHRRLGSAGASLLIGAPYAFGSLLLLEADPLMQSFGSNLTGGKLTGGAAGYLGRAVVVFLFNELAANGLGLALKRTVLTSFKGHFTLLAAAFAAVAGYWIAAAGSGAALASQSAIFRPIAAVLAAILSQAGLWAEIYLLTGMVMNALHGQPPTGAAVAGHAVSGMKKGAVYSGCFLGLLHIIGAAAAFPPIRGLAGLSPILIAVLAGAVSFPLLKTIIETFDGSQAFFRRARISYQKPILYLRGAIVGLGLGSGFAIDLPHLDTTSRICFGADIGFLTYAGASLIGDFILARQGRGRIQSLRVYLVQGLLGGAIGAGIGFYLDANQVGVVLAKFQRYLTIGAAPEVFGEYPFLSKWGYINLGTVSGGASLLFAESLAGVISWSIPAWLFALNRTFMAAFFQKESSPIRGLFTREGLVGLMDNMLAVLRWGLWMSPIIKSFLRQMGEPTWYNQDGAIRTVIAIIQDFRLTPEAFRDWSLHVFIALLAYDSVRILIWLDHMGLRVATLVNLSFLGMDKLEEKLARFLGPAATARCIPEGVKRFATWAPLLIPFYIPRGADWDAAWSQSEAIQRSQPSGLGAALGSMSTANQFALIVGAAFVSTATCTLIRCLRQTFGGRPLVAYTLANADYEVTLKANGEVISQVRSRGYDVTRRSYDLLDPAGRALYLVESTSEGAHNSWPVLGNFPSAPLAIARDEDKLTASTSRHELRTTVAISLPSPSDSVELWTIKIENLSDRARSLKLTPYLEWVLSRPDADRGHTQYNRLFAEMEYVSGLHGVLAWDRHSRSMGLLAADIAPEGFLTARVDFIGRARSVATPRALETLAFSPASDAEAHATFDPIAALLIGVSLAPKGSATIRLLIGATKDKQEAIDRIARHLQLASASAVSADRKRAALHPIRHGEIPPGTSLPYYSFSDDGRTMTVRTPFTPRPYDHVLSNVRGHIVSLTNRGLHTTASWNSQQNRLTPDWADTVTREFPSEAFYLYDPASNEWFSPTYHPLNDPLADHEVDFATGSATYRMTRGSIASELSVYVPPDAPLGVYHLTVRNNGDAPRRLRLAPYFQIVLAGQPEHSGPLQVHHDSALNALFFVNPRNTFRTGPAFVAMSCPAQRVETKRGRFFGTEGGVANPAFVEQGEPDGREDQDHRAIAAFLADLEIPAQGECTVTVLLGQADDRRSAEVAIREFINVEDARKQLEATRQWWDQLLDAVRIETDDAEFDRYLDWLKYQALAERIWARRGFYQASGAFGYRDQLQDSINLLWMDPKLARRQILLHSAQQFVEGDVVHWFHLLQDGRTGFAGRTHASDNLLWLVWGVVEYIAATGDESLLSERTPYLEAEQAFEPLPAGKHGMGFVPLRSSSEDTVYRHCMRSIDLVLDRRMGVHGLPLIGTGDWNDGLDEIGSQGRGESVWLGFFLYYILDRMVGIIGKQESTAREEAYRDKLGKLRYALEGTWRGDRYLRAFHDNGTEIGVEGSGIWEIDALTAAWAVMSGINPQRGRTVFETALRVLDKDEVILLGWPPLREDSKPYLGRSSAYPEGVRENGMYCHGVQWLVGAARVLAEQSAAAGATDDARRFLDIGHRLWRKITPLAHLESEVIERYGGQPNKQSADMVTTFDPGRMIWHGYTGAAGWLFRQAIEGVLGLRLQAGAILHPREQCPTSEPRLHSVTRDVSKSPLPTEAHYPGTRRG